MTRIVALLGQRLGLDALWVFGSIATGRPRADSDVDLGALFPATPDMGALAEARADLGILIGRGVDLVDLDAASPLLAFQAVKHGTLLYEGSPRRRVLFTAELIGRYEDLMILRAPVERAAIERLRGRA